ncbi:MAG: gliding motility-associated C-terminal domain-containing protein, partial [Flavobacteriales bacterium]
TMSLTAIVETGATIIWNQDFWGTWEDLTWTLSDIPLQADGMYSAYAVLNGCASEVSTAYLEVVPLPLVQLEDFETLTVFRCPDGSAVMDLPEYDPAYIADWTFTDLDGNEVDFGTGSIFETVADGTYDVSLTTGSPCDLQASGAFEVETVVCEMTIPNVFSPNQDGDNDSFGVPGLSHFPRSTCAIYNRWGNVVYESSDFGNSAGWEPSPEESSEGTYYYVIFINRNAGVLFIEDQFGSREITENGPLQLTGSVTLVR